MIPEDLRSNILAAIVAVEACLRVVRIHSSFPHECSDSAEIGDFEKRLTLLQVFLHRVSENGMAEYYRTYAEVGDILKSARRLVIRGIQSTPTGAHECRAFADSNWSFLAPILNDLPAEAKRPKARHQAITFEESMFPPDPELANSVSLQIQDVARSILGRIGEDPREWLALGPRRFEELLAEIWSGFGWQTILTPPVGDGGFDVRAVRNEYGITLCYLLEAKCYAPDRPVGVEIVRQLVGVVEREKASHGVIATTSRYTKGARTEIRDRQYRLTLADFKSVLDWVRTYRRMMSPR